MMEAEKQLLVDQIECCSSLDYEGGIENLKREIESVCDFSFHLFELKQGCSYACVLISLEKFLIEVCFSGKVFSYLIGICCIR